MKLKRVLLLVYIIFSLITLSFLVAGFVDNDQKDSKESTEEVLSNNIVNTKDISRKILFELETYKENVCDATRVYINSIITNRIIYITSSKRRQNKKRSVLLLIYKDKFKTNFRQIVMQLYGNNIDNEIKISNELTNKLVIHIIFHKARAPDIL